MNKEGIYNQEFIALTQKHIISAEKILNIIFQYYRPKNIIDVGCGSGSWLKAAGDMGVESLTGIDGKWLKREMLLSDDIKLITHDLDKSISLSGNFELAISLEVAEHLPENRAESFIEDLCKLSKVILFSAAIPNQGGDNHINEQWQSYWYGMFRDKNYRGFDIIRHQVWEDEQVKSWYKQNCLIYVHKDFTDTFNLIDHSKYPLDIVHKDIYSLNPDKFKYLQIISSSPPTFNLWQGLTLFLLCIVSILLFLVMINSY